MKLKYFLLFMASPFLVVAQSNIDKINLYANDIEPKVIEWRRHIHQNPELSNREFKTAEMVAKHLKSLGIEVTEKIAHTGVKGVLKGKYPGPVIALRADMDALPVTERGSLPFKSEVVSEYNGVKTGVMHACGHDTHVAILMGVAEILSKMKDQLHGTVVFIFQPAEEGAPKGEEGGAPLMIKEKVLENPKVEAIFGLHINSQTEVGTIRYREKGIMAAADRFELNIIGRQAHGSKPWSGVDPIVTAAQIINGFQTIVSRHSNLTIAPVVITVGYIQCGVRNNIIPESCKLLGTIRTLDQKMQEEVHKKMKEMSMNIAKSQGAEINISIHKQVPVNYNDPELTRKSVPILEQVAGKGNVLVMVPSTGGEDFAFFANEIPGFFFRLGGMEKGKDPKTAPSHHTPDFYLDESGMKLGIKAFVGLTMDYLGNGK